MANGRLKRLRDHAASRQGWLCHWCDTPMTDGSLQSSSTQVTGEHLDSHSNGGRTSARNVVAACYGCNQRKANQAAPPPIYILMRKLTYLRSVGLYCEYPWSEERQVDQPNFGRCPDGEERIWAPQYGIVPGPAGMTRKMMYHATRHPSR